MALRSWHALELEVRHMSDKDTKQEPGLPISREVNAKALQFIHLTITKLQDGGGESGGSESRESRESSESSESGEGGEAIDFLQSILAVNPGPDEWGPLLGLVEPIARIAGARNFERK